MTNKPVLPKMSRKEAKILWDSLDESTKVKFNMMFKELQDGKLCLKEVNITPDEKIKNIVLDHKDKPGISDKPFYSQFKSDK